LNGKCANYELSQQRGSPQAVVSKLWPDDPSTQVEETVRNVKICKNGRNYVMAATPEKSETYVFDGIKVRDREVGGSNPLAPTN
jgi:hypothetical protein